MYKRRSRVFLHILIPVLLIAVIVLFVLWWRGVFLPRFITWNEHVEASDDRTDGVVESVVLKSRHLIVYSSGSEVYRSPSSMKVQEVLWADVNGSGEKEVIALYWRRGSDGEETEGLSEDKGIGFKQHIAVFDGAASGMNLLWESAALTMDADSVGFDNGRLIITEPQGKETLWMWNGTALVPAR